MAVPLALVFIAAILIIVGVKGQYTQFGNLFNETFFKSGTGSGFVGWTLAILALAVVFRLIQAPKAGELFIGLLLLVYFLSHNKVLPEIESAIGNIPNAPAAQTTATVRSGPDIAGSIANTLNGLTGMNPSGGLF